MKALIIGGGIGGLTTAIALQKKGIDFELYEQAPAIKEVGAGLWIASNAQNIFDRLGILEKIKHIGKDLEIINVADTSYKVISRVSLHEIKEQHRYGTLAVHRAELQKILFHCLPPEKIHTSCHLKEIRDYHESSTEKISAHFDNGSAAEGDIVICCDGIKSVGRKYVYPQVNFRYSGQTCWRFISEFVLPADQRNQMYEMWGPGKGMRAAWSQVDDRQVYCYLTLCAREGGRDEDSKSVKQQLKKLFSGYPPLLNELIDSASGEKIIRNDLGDFAPIDKWHNGKVVLAGDAAHATTPNLGQGACQAIESAWVLAECLSKYKTTEEAFSAYEKIRMKKAHFITDTSWKIGRAVNAGRFMKAALKFFMRNLPGSFERKQFDKIYTLNY